MLEGPIPMEWERHGAEAEQGHLTITINTPETRGTGLSKYSLYTLESSIDSVQFSVTSASVQRRFSDFEWLHQRLVKRFLGKCFMEILKYEKKY